MTTAEFKSLTGASLADYAHQCHAASLLVVQVLGEGHRVARGYCPGVGSQHSWVIVGDDCYDPKAKVLDPTLWSYAGEQPGIWSGRADAKPHTPHGSGSIWQWGQPVAGDGDPITLAADFSPMAQRFLDMLGPLDLQGWAQLAHAPVGGWPATEIFSAMYEDERLSARLPIDVVGMVTDHNPGGLYLP